MMAQLIDRKHLKQEMKELLRSAQVSPRGMTCLYLALVLVLNLTPLPLWVEWIGFDRHTPASLLGEAYWDDCFGGPLGDFAAGSLPRPEHLSYAPEADQFLAELEKLAAQEEVIEAAEAEQAEAEQSEKES